MTGTVRKAVAEVIGTFLFVFSIIGAINSGNVLTPLVIGAVGGISGGGINPAVALGLSVSGQFDRAMLWLYVLAPVVGAALAALLFRALNADDVKRVAADRAPHHPAK